MPYPGKLVRLAVAQGISVEELVRRAIVEYGTEYKAAQALGVYPNAIRYIRKSAERSAQKSKAPA